MLYRNGTHRAARSRGKHTILDSIYGEGRCPVVPLVFKTSLGAVRPSEGSTPSLLRQSRDPGEACRRETDSESSNKLDRTLGALIDRVMNVK